jgi:hypothetical protein
MFPDQAFYLIVCPGIVIVRKVEGVFHCEQNIPKRKNPTGRLTTEAGRVNPIEVCK